MRNCDSVKNLNRRDQRTPFLKFYGDDWIGGTLGLTLEQKGFYIEVLLRMWQRKGPIPNDPVWIARSLQCDVRIARRVLPVLIFEKKLKVVGDWLENTRMMRSIEERFGETSEELPANLPEKSPKSPAKVSDNVLENSTKTNGAAPNTVPPYSRSQSPESREEKKDKKVKVVRGSRLALDWSLPDDWKRWAVEKFPHVGETAVLLEAEKFGNYWHAESGQKASKLDWEATWRNWCLRGLAAKPHVNGHSVKPLLPVEYSPSALKLRDEVLAMGWTP